MSLKYAVTGWWGCEHGRFTTFGEAVKLASKLVREGKSCIRVVNNDEVDLGRADGLTEEEREAWEAAEAGPVGEDSACPFDCNHDHTSMTIDKSKHADRDDEEERAEDERMEGLIT